MHQTLKLTNSRSYSFSDRLPSIVNRLPWSVMPRGVDESCRSDSIGAEGGESQRSLVRTRFLSRIAVMIRSFCVARFDVARESGALE